MKKIKMFLSMCILFTAVMLCGTVSKAAQELEINTPVQVSTTEGTYQFTIEKQGKVVLSATPEDGKSDIYGKFTLYEIDEDENEIEVVSVGDYFGYKVGNVNTTPVRLPAGTYIIKYSYSYFDTRNANLTIQYTEENAGEYESEKNNTWSTANTIELNKEYKANLQSNSDVDTYQFDLKQEGSLCLNLRNIGTIADRWKVALYVEDADSNHNLIASWTSTSNKNSKFTRYRLPKGKYYIQVSRGDSFTTDDYSIGTTYVAETSNGSEIEYNDSLSTANQIDTNTEYKANISTTKDVDYFIFTIEKTSKITVQVGQETDTVTAGLYNVTLYRKDEADNLVIYDRFNTVSNKVSKGNVVTAPEGTYIVFVKNNNGTAEDQNDYILKIVQEETAEEVTVPDTPQDVEGQSGIPVAVNSTTLVSTKEGRYLFMIPKDGIITLSATPEDGKSDIYGKFTLYEIDEDENEIEVVSVGDYFGYKVGNVNTTPVRLPAGTYIIKYYYSYYSDTRNANLTIQYDEIPDLSEAVIDPISDKVYIGDAIIPELTVTYKGKKLEDKKDYTVTCSNNIFAGTAVVTINPVENASVGTQSTSFTITKRKISAPVVQQSEFVYDGTAKQILLSSAETKYLIAENDRQVNAGVYTATYTIDTNNCVWEDGQTGAVSIPWSIKKANATISVSTITYTKTVGDAAFTLTGISTNSDGKVQYTVTQGADVVSVNAVGQVTPLKAGTAVISVMIPATANYNGSVAKTINVLIKEKETEVTDNTDANNSQSISKVTKIKAKISKATNKKGKKIVLKLSGLSDCAGYQLQYGTKSNFKGAKTVKKSSNSVTLKNLKKGKKYYIRVRVYEKIAGEFYYGKWSNKKSVKIKK